MLDELVVENLGIIERAHLQPGSGLVAFTGETGAGKTMLLGALRLLVGGAARGDLIGPYGPQARVEGRFLGTDGEEIVAARSLAPGRSRAYVNGDMVTAGALEELGTGLIEMVAQHEKHGLSRPAEVQALIDRSLPAEGGDLLSEYRQAWIALSALRAERDQLGGDRRTLERELDLVGYQADEIEAAGFSVGDDQHLAIEAARLRHAEELTARLGEARNAIEQAAEQTGGATSQLRKSAELDHSLRDPTEQSEVVLVALGELGTDLRLAFESVQTDPREAESIEARVAQLGDLRRKYGETLDEVLEFAAGAKRRRDELNRRLAGAEQLEIDLATAEQAVIEAGDRLLTARRQTAEVVATAALGHLQELGIPAPVVRLVVEPAEPGPAGANTSALLFSSDDRLDPGPVGRVASGGELSRLILSLRLAGGAGRTPVVAFDEIDAGVGGKTALALGRKLAALAKDRQVLCVTHLPQVAAFADRHFVINRTGTTVAVSMVEKEPRLEELSRMLAGLPESEQGRSHAEELVAMAIRERA